ncbi:MAG: type II toxin-antitoxin system VapB family antitoxin [Ilumatobacteraceae bacterium]|nr:type II toxin-antitoxin system VapB family antitoxin [Ilumatobacteraceae bacterium]
MALSIKSDRADRLARELADLTGESLTDVVITSLQLRLADERRVRARRTSLDDILACAHALPILDHRTDDEILGYDDRGLPA